MGLGKLIIWGLYMCNVIFNTNDSVVLYFCFSFPPRMADLSDTLAAEIQAMRVRRSKIDNLQSLQSLSVNTIIKNIDYFKKQGQKAFYMLRKSVHCSLLSIL